MFVHLKITGDVDHQNNNLIIAFQAGTLLCDIRKKIYAEREKKYCYSQNIFIIGF